MKANRKWLMVIALVLSMTMATASTLAFLTDRDTVENTFTLGNVDIEVEEEFEPNSPLNPGVEVEKKAGIENVHKTSDAWVWMTVSVPEELADYVELGWSDESLVEDTDPVHDGYVSYLVKHPTKLAPGESTPQYLESVTLSDKVDFQDGQYVVVDNGEIVATIGDLSDVKVIVDGFAMQTTDMADVDAAYDAYNSQWNGMNGGESGANGGVPKNGDDDTVTFDIPADAVRVETASEMETAVAGGATKLILAPGEYNMNMNATAGKTLELYGESKDAILYCTNEGENGADYDFDGSTVTFTNLTLSSTKNTGTYPGYARMSATYNDCVIDQTYDLYAGDQEFNYCTLNVSGDKYNIWTWGAQNATFNNCTFNSDGKAVLLYGQANTKLTLNDCLFNDNGGLTALKAAVEIGNDYNKSYELYVNNTTVNGYEINDQGINTGSTLWGNKNSMPQDKLNVVVDGVDVY